MSKKLDYSYTQNRELSWLKFDERVLEEAEDNTVPLLERLKFISIFTSNLDEFFMIRCGSLYDLTLVKKDHVDNKTGLNPYGQLDAIFERSKPLYPRRDEIFEKISEKLDETCIHRLEFNDLSDSEQKHFNKYFFDFIFPVLSPQIIDVQHPFPHIVNKTLNLVLLLEDKGKQKHNKHSKYNEGEEIFGFAYIPSSLPRLLFSPEDHSRYILIEDLIYEYANEIFINYKIRFKSIVSVTRNADINLSSSQIDDDEDYRQYMKKILKKRDRLAPIRLEIYKYFDEELVDFLVDKLNINSNQVFLSKCPLDMSFVFELEDKIKEHNRKLYDELTYVPYTPKIANSLKESDIIPYALKKDILLSYPYESIEPFLELLREAALDENVLSIKITIYRLAKNSAIVNYLLLAIDKGKDVTVLMELKARFDEKNNIHYAELLEEAGAQVLYGFEKYKVHSKICLITRREKGNIQYLTQLGTGNYNEKTCKLYTDFCYITSNNEIGEDAMVFFKNMAISNLEGAYDHLLVAPNHLKKPLSHLINKEIAKAKKGLPASIVMKMNSLTDRHMIDKLKKASVEGVKIKLIIRGICCLIPGIPGVTDNIEVVSIVGRLLEHSRIYCFGNGEDTKLYLSSADLMTRNMNKRVEIAFPICDEQLKKRVIQFLNIQLKDNVKARMIDSKGDYEKLMRGVELLNSQKYFMEEDVNQFYKTKPSEKSFLNKVKNFFNI